MSLTRLFTTDRRSRATAAGRRGFTLVEIVISLAVLGTMASGVYVGFNAINTYAVSSRLYSEALTAAQNQIDLILSKEPFDIKAANISGTFDPSLNKIPAEVMLPAELDALAASVPFPTAAPSATPATNSAYYPYYPYYRPTSGGSSPPLTKQAFIYQDPQTGVILVTGTLTSTITDAAMTSDFINAGTTLNVRKANVTVSYTFRGRTYNVSMDTLRTADQ
ncbi:MAG: prepilin-type N-terminal cleavage/methylation domain-containing protein [Verrucomicrobiota bacterium]|nr:prepilin-type N-terminal cleavage/methylation domain-containing protein [Verrucomicrobiota bacterium]